MEKIKVLFVDSEKTIRDLMKKMLEIIFQERGLEAELFFAGKASLACQMIKQASFDLVFVELALLGAQSNDGLEVARTCDCPCILMAGFGIYGDDEAEVKKLAVSDVLLKPFDMQSMAEAVSTALGWD